MSYHFLKRPLKYSVMLLEQYQVLEEEDYCCSTGYYEDGEEE